MESHDVNARDIGSRHAQKDEREIVYEKSCFHPLTTPKYPARL